MSPRRLSLLLVALVLVVCAGCQMQVAVDVQVQPDGSGQVTAAIGLDDSAMSRVTDLADQLRIDDLTKAGWQVEGPTREDDGYTWVRATKAFSDPAEADVVLGELTGPDGAFRDFSVTRSSSLLRTSYGLTGTVDLTQGPQSFSDQQLAAALGGDPFGGTLSDIEAEEGRPVSDMVDFTVTVSLPGAAPRVYTPSFADTTPTTLDVSSSQGSWLSRLWIWAVVIVVGAVVLVVLRKAFTRR